MTTHRAESRMVSVPLQTLRWPPKTASSDAAPRWRSVRKPHVYKRTGRKRSAIRQPCAAPAIKHRSPGDAGCTLGRDAYQTRLDARPLGPTNSRSVPTVDFACSRRPQAHRALLPSRPAVRHGFGHRCRPSRLAHIPPCRKTFRRFTHGNILENRTAPNGRSRGVGIGDRYNLQCPTRSPDGNR